MRAHDGGMDARVAPVPGDDGPDAHAPACPAGQKRCGGLCTAPAPVVGCGLVGCEPCPGYSRGGISCEGERCNAPPDATLEDIPLSTGCVDASDPAANLPPPPLAAGTCGDAVTTDPSTLAEGCCFYGCYRGHHYYTCRPPMAFGQFKEAQAACRAVGMKLVEISDHYENEFVSRWAAQLGANNAFVIGLSTMDDANVWRWSTLNDDRGPILYDHGVLTQGAYSALWPFSHEEKLFPCTGCYVRMSGFVWSGQANIMVSEPFVCESVD